jgi:small subunit ribosomal protein S31
MADPNAKKIFGDKQAAMKYFDSKNMKSAPTSYWDELENCKVDIVNLWNLPKNAFEEQILWTEQGKMWPYPIDNEYLLGEEDNVSFYWYFLYLFRLVKVNFTEHIFLDRYLAKHKHLPKDGPIAHFMELVCVGLSKNPYMTLAKKHMHLDSFAEFFNPEQIKRVHVLHEQAKKEAL